MRGFVGRHKNNWYLWANWGDKIYKKIKHKMIQSHGFLGHEVVEFLFRNKTILIEVCSLHHLLQCVVILKFPQPFGNFSQILQRNKSSSSSVKSNENFVNLVPWFVLWRPGGHHAKELVEFKLPATIFVDFSNHMPNSFSFSFNTQRVDSFLKLWINEKLPLGSIDPPPS